MTSALTAAKRSYPTSEVRGRSWEDPTPEGWQPRGVTQQRPRVPGWDGAGMAEKSYPSPRSGAVARWSYPRPHDPKPKDRGSYGEELPHAPGQGWRLGGPTPHPRNGGCAGAREPREAIPC